MAVAVAAAVVVAGVDVTADDTDTGCDGDGVLVVVVTVDVANGDVDGVAEVVTDDDAVENLLLLSGCLQHFPDRRLLDNFNNPTLWVLFSFSSFLSVRSREDDAVTAAAAPGFCDIF